jgi:hypothetical protein
MGDKPKYVYPEPKELQRLLDERGVVQVARDLGMHHSTLGTHARRHGLTTAKKAVLGQPDPTPPEDEGVSELEIAQHRIKELESALRKDRKANVYDERVARAVEEAAGRCKSKYSPQVIAKSHRKKTEHVFVLDWSDLHAGEVVSLEETGGLNEYNWEIMLKRQDRLREALFSYQDNRPYPVKKLHVFALGDMLSGNIHGELEATNEIPLAEATVQLGLDGAEWLESLAERFDLIEFAGVVGNHPRAHKKPWAKQGYDNADWTSYHVMATSLKKNKRITFDIPKANQHRVIVADKFPNLLWHGDGVRSSMPGIPWGGVSRRVNALRHQYAAANLPIDYFHNGHFHQANAVEQGRIIVNGSVKGVDEYSLKAFGGGQPPCQVLSTFHPNRGLTDVSFLECE